MIRNIDIKTNSQVNIIGKLLEQASDGNQVLAIKVVWFHLLREHSQGLRRDYSRIEES